MTVSTSISNKSYTGNGVTTSFPLTSILFYDETHIKVYLDSVLQTSGYTVSGVGTTSGYVTFSVAPANLVNVYISRIVPNTQETDFANFDGNPSDVTEKQFDLTTMQIQQVTSDIADSILAPSGVTLATNRITGTVDSTVRLVGVSTSGPSTVDVGDVSASFDSVFTGLANKDLITYNGSTWVNAAQINATNIPNTTITAAMMNSGAATAGQVPIANGSGGVAYGTVSVAGILIDVQTFTSSGTWTKPSGTTAVEVWVVGGGGGSGGTSTGSGAGGNGGTSSFGAHCSATGGSGSTADTSGGAGSRTGGAAGSASGGTINIAGRSGGNSYYPGSGTVFIGGGGYTPLGIGGRDGGGGTVSTISPQAGVGYGSGASGQHNSGGYQTAGAGSGGYSYKYITSGLGATETVTVGTAGSAGAAGSGVAGAAGSAGIVIVKSYA